MAKKNTGRGPSLKERWLWLHADVTGWWHRHGFTVVRQSEIRRLRRDLHGARLTVRALRGPDGTRPAAAARGRHSR